jgi:hypothetical protein
MTMNGMTATVGQDILELEKLCEQMYNANSPQQIHDANKLLENFTTTSDCLAKCQIILNRGAVSYQFALHYSSAHHVLTRRRFPFQDAVFAIYIMRSAHQSSHAQHSHLERSRQIRTEYVRIDRAVIMPYQ